MSAAPRAFRGLLGDFLPVDGGVAYSVHVDLADSGHLMVAVGVPPGVGRVTRRYDRCPSVALFPCRTPRHPVRDRDVLAEAAIDGLIDLLEAGLPVTPDLAARFDALRARLDGTPIHLMPAANADEPEGY